VPVRRQPEVAGEVVEVAQPSEEVSVGFSILKGHRPELILQKLTELGVDRIFPLLAERSIVRWDADKCTLQHQRFLRIVREAAMQSRRVRLPVVERITEPAETASRPGTALAQAGGRRLQAGDRTILVGPEGGWTPQRWQATMWSTSARPCSGPKRPPSPPEHC